jgi:HAD superfamily hydrolase (TIGR01509 family)
MIKAVVFDIGGVILRTKDRSCREQLEKQYNLPAGGADELVFNSRVSHASTIGLVENAAVWENVKKYLSLSDQQLEEFKKAFWKNDFVDHDLLQFLQTLRPDFKTALLSNAWKNFRCILSNVYHIDEGLTVDYILISSELGLAKPDPAVYQILSDTINCEFKEILFVDDFIENITAAKFLGINTIHYQQGIDLIKEIKLKLKK